MQPPQIFLFILFFQVLGKPPEIVGVLDLGAVAEFAANQGAYIVDVCLVCLLAIGRNEDALGSVVGPPIGFPAVIGPEHQGHLLRKYVPAHQQAGIIGNAELYHRVEQPARGTGDILFT